MPLFQIPRNTLLWLLGAQTLLIIPHLSRLPIWMLLAWFIVVVWRVQIFRGRWPFPNRWIKGLIVALCIMGLFSEYGRFFGIEPMIGLLITAFLLKLLEMRQKRDALIVIFLGYFVAATQFLFSATLVATTYVVLTITTLTTALLGLHQSAGHRYPWRSFKFAGMLVAQSLPLMLVLFVVMPRIGSLWAVPQQQHSARSGVNDSMSPGDFSNLVQDNATAFRVTFDGAVPAPRFLYWRGLVFSEFDGRRWTQTEFSSFRGEAINWTTEEPKPWRRLIKVQGEPLGYEIILEPTQQPWLYALATPTAKGDGIGLTRDFRLVYRRPVRNRYQYEVESHLNYSIASEGLSPRIRQRELSLPENANPRSQQQARQWMADASNPRDYIERVLDYFNREFIYTLEPPLLGQHPVDDFLWQSKRGFCEHFSSAFVVMMRAAGIPARIVVGYQGGELNPLKNFLVVKQADAHAWSEVWLAGEGWVRVDPTAAVAPQRIESGLGGALSPADRNLLDNPFSLENYRGIPLFSLIALRLEVLEYDWHRWVMNYDQDKQRGLLRNILGAIEAWRIAALVLGTGTVVFALVGASLLLSGLKPRRGAADTAYRRFLRVLKRRGVERGMGEGPRTLLARVGEQRPDLASWAGRVTDSYERCVYAGDDGALVRLKALVARPPRDRKGERKSLVANL
ncbi:MAG: DUF3488 and transglutaminase-like domain-containing protein [Cellvibrionaceae bacterium]